MAGARNLDLAAVKKADKDEIAREMVVLAENTPRTVAEAYEGGEKPNATVDQIEWETSRRGDNDGVGRIPALFVMFGHLQMGAAKSPYT